MSRLIDADALKQADFQDFSNTDVFNAIDEVPAIDAVPVVRCGECIKPLTECPFKEYVMLKTDYCSHGVKMEVEQDG